MSLETERVLAERRHRLMEAMRTIQSEVGVIDAQLAAERVKRVAGLDARIAAREEADRVEAERRRNPVPFNESHEERQEMTA